MVPSKSCWANFFSKTSKCQSVELQLKKMQFNIFRKWLKSDNNQETKCKSNEKYRPGSTNDPILEAMQEKQPFEQAIDTFSIVNPNRGKNQNSFFTTKDGTPIPAKDIFGDPIITPDRSNPTRSSDERPLDTIRSFEYSISGDPRWKPSKSQLSTKDCNLMTSLTTPKIYGSTTPSSHSIGGSNQSCNEKAV